jgi:molybdate transport system substrate-binding protein
MVNPPRVLRGTIIAVILVLAACAPASPVAPNTAPAPVTLTVFAAASLTDALIVIKTNFEAENPGATIVYNFGGSSGLAQQLGQAAPADVFASANATQMNVAIEAGRVIAGTPQVFARNQLVVITPADNPGDIADLQGLASPGLRLVLAAAEVPVGEHTLAFLAKASEEPIFGAGYREAVLANVVSYEDNVRAVLAKVALGEVDAGIVYASDVSGEGADQVAQIAIPDTLNTIAQYPIAVIADSTQPAAAQAFVAFMLSDAGQATLESFGFLRVDR